MDAQVQRCCKDKEKEADKQIFARKFGYKQEKKSKYCKNSIT